MTRRELYARFVMPHLWGVDPIRKESYDRLCEDFGKVEGERQKAVDLAFARWKERGDRFQPEPN
jgi:hypothetical protein